jgi:hypothetical protein
VNRLALCHSDLIETAAAPGEFCLGHAGRFAQLNGFNDSMEFFRAFGWPNESIFTWRDSYFSLLAAMSELSVANYLHDHSTALFWRLRKRNIVVGHIKALFEEQLTGVAMRTLRRSAYWCPTCIENDLGADRVSYWRRHHQIPGVHYCAVHGTPLHCVVGAKAFNLTPDGTRYTSTVSPVATKFPESAWWMIEYARTARMIVEAPWSSPLWVDHDAQRFVQVGGELLDRLLRERSLALDELPGYLALDNPIERELFPELGDAVKSYFNLYLGNRSLRLWQAYNPTNSRQACLSLTLARILVEDHVARRRSGNADRLCGGARSPVLSLEPAWRDTNASTGEPTIAPI